MNENAKVNTFCFRRYLPATMLLYMKFTAFLLLVFCLQVQAKTYSQKVSIKGKNMPLEKVFDILKSQTGYDVLYNPDLLKKTKPVSLSVKDVELETALEICFKDQPVSFLIRYNTIVVTNKPEEIFSGTNKIAGKPDIAVLPVKGTVTDEAGKPLAGVSVLVKGTNLGTTTNADGTFEINIPDEAAKALVFSYVGMETKEITIGSNHEIKVSLQAVTTQQQEVVVIGYGTQKKKLVTGAISTVSESDLNVATTPSFEQALGGRAAGVTVTQASGQPGASVSIKIRANPSFADAGALFVVDGVVVNDNAGEASSSTYYSGAGVDRSPLNFINPNDIETISFLKDASATAIYGARAGAGVVLITTKKGKAGKPVLTYDGSKAWQQSKGFYELLNSKEYMDMRNKVTYEAYLAAKKIAPYGNTNPGSVPAFVPVYTQAQIDAQPILPSAMDAITRPGSTQQHNLSLSGAANEGATKYYASFNYYTQTGVLLKSDLSRYNGRLNLEQAIGRRIKMGANIIASGTKASNASVDPTQQFERAGMIVAAIYHPANLPLQDDAGNYTLNPLYQNAPNPLSFREITDYTINSRILASGFVEARILQGLTAKASFSWDNSTSSRYSFLPTTFLKGGNVGGEASVNDNKLNSKLVEYTLNYDKSMGAYGNISALLGHSYQYRDNFYNGVYNNHLGNDFSFYNIASGTNPAVSTGADPTRVWKSYFGRVIYSFKDRYVLTGSVRRDGASHFADNKKWGTFPSISGAWIISEEAFLKNSSKINFLKLRAGYGTVGNSEIGGSAFAYYDNGGFWKNYAYVFGNTAPIYGVGLSQQANPNLTWETARDLNFGVDFQLLKNRISGSVDYYIRRISGLLAKVPLPTAFPISSVFINSGTSGSRGWEVSLTTKNVISKAPGGFNWSTTFNIGHHYEYWIKRDPQALKVLEKYIDPTGAFYGVYGYSANGIYQGGTVPSGMTGILPGEVIIKDIMGVDANGNYTKGSNDKIGNEDRTLLYLGIPTHNFGFNNTLTYRNFDFTLYTYGALQKKVNSDYTSNNPIQGSIGNVGQNTLSLAQQLWRHDNTSAKYPTVLTGNYSGQGKASDFWVENANYLRIRDITLGYTFDPRNIVKQKLFTSLRVYVTSQNPYVFTKYSGVDPELNTARVYPMVRSFVVGVNAKLF